MADQIELENNKTLIDEQGLINLPTGKLSLHMLRQVLRVLPFEMDLADADDNFVNTRATKQLGQPFVATFAKEEQEAVAMMLADLHKGAADHFEQWFPKNEQTIYVNFYAIRDIDGTFLGTLQFTGDITRIQGFRGIRTAFNAGKSDK